MKYMIPVGLSIALAAMSAHVEARSESCHAATEKQIASLFDRWKPDIVLSDFSTTGDGLVAGLHR